jgi:hypothetical protein
MILRNVLMALPILIGLSVFDRSGYYTVFSSGTHSQIDSELTVISGANFYGKNALQGALLMKRAGFRTSPIDKLHDFRKGATLLEAAISADSINTEYRFLRLVIQENAPGIVNYRSDLDRDNMFIHLHFQELSPVVQQAVRDYSKHSKVLKLEN